MKCLVFTVWLLMLFAYAEACMVLIPPLHSQNYDRYRKSGISIGSAILFHSIWLSWLLRPSLPEWYCFVHGVVSFGSGSALVIAARRVNPFFVPVIRRPAGLVSHGPYRLFRHPGYVGFFFMGLGCAMTLGSPIQFIPLALYSLLLIRQARRENRLLYRS